MDINKQSNKLLRFEIQIKNKKCIKSKPLKKYFQRKPLTLDFTSL